ncbi:MAG: IS256 family transposase [Aliarcobacter sp.]
MKIEIDVAEFAAQLKSGKGIGGKDGALTPLIKQLTEMALQAELETHLSQDLEKNRKNGTTSKTMKSANGTFELETPRDRNLEGKKEILGLYLNQSEGAKFWLQVLTDLQNRGVEDILIASVDGLKGFPEAINAVFPDTEVQLCIVHQIRNSLKYVASKNQKQFANELKKVYQAFTEEEARSELDKLENKWGKKYPIVFESWNNKWDNLSNYFKYAEPIRKVIYTTNIIESVHRQFRTLTKTKGAFPNDNSLLKLLYAGIQNAEKKWTMPIRNWSLTLSQLAIHFEGRLDDSLNL